MNLSGMNGPAYSATELSLMRKLIARRASISEAADALGRGPWGVARYAAKEFRHWSWQGTLRRAPQSQIKVETWAERVARSEPNLDHANFKVTATFRAAAREITEVRFCNSRAQVKLTRAELSAPFLGGKPVSLTVSRVAM